MVPMENEVHIKRGIYPDPNLKPSYAIDII